MMDVKDEDLFGALCATVRTRVPKFKVRYKNKSVWQRFLGVILFFIRGNRYMKTYTTTLGSTVWFPSEKFVDEDPWTAFKILAHEYVHLMDGQKHPVVYELFYVSPQVLAILSLIAIMAHFFSLWWLVALVALLFLLPIPSWGRTEIEKRGYAMGLMINMLRHGDIRQEKRESLQQTFGGPDYYWMSRNKEDIDEWINEVIELTRNIDKINTPETIFGWSNAYQDVYELLTGISFDH